jgi:hypothetical protein
MSNGKRTPLRQRSWPGDKADSRAVGEALRGVSDAITGQPHFRVEPFFNRVYSSSGLTFAAKVPPLGVLCIYAEEADGTLTPAAVSGMTFNGATVTVTLSGLTAGTKYATIRLLVIG